MTSTGLAAETTPENIAAREPTQWNMDFLTPAEASERWGASPEERRITTVEGNTVRVLGLFACLTTRSNLYI